MATPDGANLLYPSGTHTQTKYKIFRKLNIRLFETNTKVNYLAAPVPNEVNAGGRIRFRHIKVKPAARSMPRLKYSSACNCLLQCMSPLLTQSGREQRRMIAAQPPFRR
jgi:hypothetical protein